MAEQGKSTFQRVESKTNGTYFFDGDMLVNRDIWEVVPVNILAEMLLDIQVRVKQNKGLKQPEQIFEYGEHKIIFTDKQSREKSQDESIEKFTRRRNHAFTVKVEEG